MEELKRLFIISAILSFLTISRCHNITQILASDSSYSEFNKQLSQTRLADEINTRETITVLVLSNSNMASVTSYSQSAIKNLLSLLVVLDYLDEKKLKNISNHTAIFTTLYQTSGLARENEGFINITDLNNDQVAFGSAIKGSVLKSSFVKTIKTMPYNISVVEISAPVVIPSMISALPPSSSAGNLTQILNKNGCHNFSSLLSSTNVLKDYESVVSSGLTIFAFTDKAFAGPRAADLKKLNGPDLSMLMRYHASPSYAPLGTLMTKKSIDTMATRGTGKYRLNPTTAAGGVALSTGVDSAKIVDTVLDSIPVSVFTVDNILLPVELFGKNKSSSESPAPAPAPETLDAPLLSPPAPAMMTPGGAPVEGPSDSSDKANSGSLAREPKWAAMAAAATTAAAVVIGLQWV